MFKIGDFVRSDADDLFVGIVVGENETGKFEVAWNDALVDDGFVGSFVLKDRLVRLHGSEFWDVLGAHVSDGA